MTLTTITHVAGVLVAGVRVAGVFVLVVCCGNCGGGLAAPYAYGLYVGRGRRQRGYGSGEQN